MQTLPLSDAEKLLLLQFYNMDIADRFIADINALVKLTNYGLVARQGADDSRITRHGIDYVRSKLL